MLWFCKVKKYTPLVDVAAREIVEKKTKMVLGFVWQLIVRFQVSIQIRSYPPYQIVTHIYRFCRTTMMHQLAVAMWCRRRARRYSTGGAISWKSMRPISPSTNLSKNRKLHFILFHQHRLFLFLFCHIHILLYLDFMMV